MAVRNAGTAAICKPAERRSDLVDEFVGIHLTNTVIIKVILDYPAEYFEQNPREYLRRSILANCC